MLDKTHLVLCMKRLFTLSTSQHCDADVLRHDHRFQVLPLSLSITRHTRHDTHSMTISLTLTHDHRFQVLSLQA